MADVPFSCTCGKVTGIISSASPSSGNHIACFCDSCRAGALYCGVPDPKLDGVQLFQTTPDHVHVQTGQDQLTPFSFGPKNLLRWKARCCDAFLCSTPRNPKLAVTGFYTGRLADVDAIGPVKSRAFVPQPNGKAKHENLPAFIGILGRAFMARMTGRWKKTPFFDTKTLNPVAPVIQISREERRALLQAADT